MTNTTFTTASFGARAKEDTTRDYTDTPVEEPSSGKEWRQHLEQAWEARYTLLDVSDLGLHSSASQLHKILE